MQSFGFEGGVWLRTPPSRKNACEIARQEVIVQIRIILDNLCT